MNCEWDRNRSTSGPTPWWLDGDGGDGDGDDGGGDDDDDDDGYD
jgi:hypothetical protein